MRKNLVLKDTRFNKKSNCQQFDDIWVWGCVPLLFGSSEFRLFETLTPIIA